jgi:integrase
MARKKKREGFTVYRRKGSLLWQIQFTDPKTGKQVRESSKTTVEEHARELAAKKYSESWGQTNLGKQVGWTIDDLLSWAKSSIWQDCARKAYLDSTLLPLRIHLGKHVATAVGAADILGFRKTRLDEKVSVATAIHPLSYLQAAYEAAIVCGKLVANPVRNAKKAFPALFPASKKREVALDRKHQDILLNALSGILHKIVAFALRTGMRRGEILNLKRSECDLERRIIITQSRKGRKKKLKQRIVPMTPDVYEIIQSMPNYGPYVFSYDDGKPLSKDGVVHMPFRRVVRRLAKKYPLFKGLTFHGLRHSFITQGLELGGNVGALKDIVGHSTTQMTDGYTHISLGKLMSEMAIYPRLGALKLDATSDGDAERSAGEDCAKNVLETA